MSTIIVNLKALQYTVTNEVIRVSEKDVPFGTTYEVISPKTGVQKRFDFVDSTGPEFDPKTEWVYQSEDGFEFRVCNDAKLTKIRGDRYLKHKLKN